MEKAKSRRLNSLLAVLLSVCVMLTMMPLISADTAKAADTTSVNVTGTYGQTAARSMLSMINTFRTGSDAWYWNEGDATKTTCTGLQNYTYDYNLEKIAMQRAAEIALTFEHTRPDGGTCFTCTYNSTRSYGENIAAGTSDYTKNDAFVSWQETNEKYAGQGHRRNMLSSNFTAIGIAHIKYNGADFWVQEFSNTNSGAAATAANDAETTVPVNVLSSALSDIAASPAAIDVTYGESKALPVISAKTTYTGGWPENTKPVTLSGTWTSADSTVAAVSGGKIVAGKIGSTTLSSTAGGTQVSAAVTVAPISLAGADVTLANGTYTYSGSAKEPAVSSVTLDGRTLKAGTDYTVTYADNTNAGTAKVTIAGKGNYTGEITKNFAINAKDISSATVSEPGSADYTGSAVTPEITVTDGSRTLTAGADYTVTYSGNTNAGTAKVTIAGKGNYTGEITKNFAINAKDISSAEISGLSDITYTGKEIKPELTVKDGDKTLTADKDYTIAYTDNTKAGTAKVTVTGRGNYTGEITKEFNINARDIGSAEISGLSDIIYTGNAITPAVTVKDGDETLTAGTDYTVTYADNINAGTAKITVKGQGDYSGEITKKFTISPRSISSVTVSEPESADYSGSAITPAIMITDGSKTLTADKDYTVAYADNINAGTAKITVKGQGNYTGEITKNFTIAPESISGATVTASESADYSGSAITPAVTVTLGGSTLTAGTDYTVAYADNTNAGTAKVTVTGRGNYTGTAARKFTINKRDISEAVIADIPEQEYTGSAVIPKISISYNGSNLKKDTDYTVSYKNNTEKGTATVTVSGNGNFKGTASRTFVIKAVQKITLTAPEISVKAGSGSFNLGVKAAGTLAYKSSDANVVMVDALGNVTVTGPGEATITITAAGNSEFTAASATVKITIYPDQVKTLKLKKGRKKFTASWSKDARTSGYQIVYAKNKKLTKAKKTITVNGGSIGKKTVKKLKAKKNYYVKVRAFKKVGTKTLYGAYSPVKKVKVK